MENGGNLPRDRQLDFGITRESQKRRGGADAFGDHAHSREDFVKGAAFSQFDSNLAIAAR